jgi:Gas vesicle protein G
MGLFTTLLTLPLAPVRGTIWIAERVAEQAQHELGDETSIRRRLAELQMQYDTGEIGEEEYAEAEDELLARLARARRAGHPAAGENP